MVSTFDGVNVRGREVGDADAALAVMDAGRIIELGTHDDLITRDGPYAKLWRQWHG
ncbi:hypothetical protein ACPPVO_53780 [Dactylosporangium sp. McL0621]|uniref:hypothetical protein n=1 Tax=Dactylosporangium sp. McL0621 TaxID=3415678 RepID=UPI003CF6489B